MELTQLPEDDRTVLGPSEPDRNGEAWEGLGDNALPVGTLLGEFEITGLIGEGGFGIVYLAYDHSLQRKVALKEYMPSGLASRKSGMTVAKSKQHLDTFQAGLRSFINEARLLAQFDHPSLVKVHRFWEANGTAYLVMPFYDGKTLKEALRQLEGPPDEHWLKQLLRQLLDALNVIHKENCFHRDISPDNILILKDGRPLLLDFGAARRVISDMTQNLTVILKPGYAPIEQYAEMKSMKQGAWTDIYALAAVAYFAITGKTPVPAVSRIISDSLEPLVKLEHGQDRYSPAFLRTIDKALAVKPEERPQDIAGFRALLDLEGASSSAAIEQPARRAQPEMEYKQSSSSRNLANPSTSSPLKAYGFAAALFLAAFGVGWLFMREESPEMAAPEAPIVPIPAPVTDTTSPGGTREDAGTGLSKPLHPGSVTVSPEVPPGTRAEVGDRGAIPAPDEQGRQIVQKKIPRPSPKATASTPVAAPPEAKQEPPISAIQEIIDENLTEGRDCLSKKNFECAITKAENVLQFEPDNTIAQALLKDANAEQEKAWEASKLE
jgi:serine/threonine protein kinase